MDIGPVSAIRPVTGVRSFPGSSDVTRVSQTQHRDQSPDDEYTPTGDQAGRGLEDEEGEEVTDEEGSDTAPFVPPPGKVSFFA